MYYLNGDYFQQVLTSVGRALGITVPYTTV